MLHECDSLGRFVGKRSIMWKSCNTQQQKNVHTSSHIKDRFIYIYTYTYSIYSSISSKCSEITCSCYLACPMPLKWKVKLVMMTWMPKSFSIRRTISYELQQSMSRIDHSILMVQPEEHVLSTTHVYPSTTSFSQLNCDLRMMFDFFLLHLPLLGIILPLPLKMVYLLQLNFFCVVRWGEMILQHFTRRKKEM